MEKICFDTEESLFSETLSGNPREYLDIAKKVKHVDVFTVSKNVGDSNFYAGLREFIEQCSDDVEISSPHISTIDKKTYFAGEQVADEILSQIGQDWTVKQKMALIHYQLGKHLSYIPDYHEKHKNGSDVYTIRSPWEALAHRETVCNGVVNTARYLAARANVKTREVKSKTHSYMLFEDEQGVEYFDDPTWDLENSLYDAKPQYFGLSYEEYLKKDGPFSHSHELENPPESTGTISESEMREIFYSIGITNEDRTFKVPIYDKVDEIIQQSSSAQTLEEQNQYKINGLFNAYAEQFSEESKHIFEMRSITNSSLCQMGYSVKDFESRFVYAADDPECMKSKLAFNINVDGTRDTMYLIDPSKGAITPYSLEDFDKQYRVHDKSDAIEFWKDRIAEKEQETKKQEQNIE